MVRDSSIIAYQSITNSGILGSQQKQILSLLRDNQQDPFSKMHWNFTRREISKILDLEINAVSGRVNELIKKNLVDEDPVRRCSISRRRVIPVRLHKESPTTEEAAENRRQWLKKTQHDPFYHLGKHFDSMWEKKKEKNETS